MKKKWAVATATLFILTTASFIVLFIAHYRHPIAYESSTDSAPRFSYNAAQAPDWWSAGNRSPHKDIDPSSYDEAASGPLDKLPVADISIHHGGPDKKAHPDNCFVSLSYYDFPITSAETAQQETEAEMTRWGGSFERLNSTEKSLLTPEGEKQYTLHQYHTKVAAGGTYMSGTQLGYVTLRSGHIRVQGVCQTPEYLTLTLPIMDTVSLQ